MVKLQQELTGDKIGEEKQKIIYGVICVIVRLIATEDIQIREVLWIG